MGEMSFRMRKIRTHKKVKAKDIVLVVDDYRSLARTLEKHIGSAVDEVFTAGSVWEAQYILDSVPVTHLLCDLNITVEDGSPLQSGLTLPPVEHQQSRLGFELAPYWREQHPSIQKVVIYTGEEVRDLRPPSGVDALVCKTDIAEVLGALLNRQLGTCSCDEK